MNYMNLYEIDKINKHGEYPNCHEIFWIEEYF